MEGVVKGETQRKGLARQSLRKNKRSINMFDIGGEVIAAL